MFNINYMQIDNQNEKIDSALKRLEGFKDKIDIHQLFQLKTDLKVKIEDFEKREKKLRIGVIGQIKAGKSSFINSLLFKGEEVLPKAATPKTANLTVIGYAPENSLEIEFYLKQEFENMLETAKSDADTDEVKVAKEIKRLYENSGIAINDYQKKEIVKAGTYQELLGKLNEYAGENGKFTAIVKSIVLNINDERLKEIEIIDTPGMNDPVILRTEKTRKFMKSADVVFFLSPSTQFLDKNDMELLVRQMPQHGVQSFVLIGSKFDSAIIDDGWNRESYEETVEGLKESLTGQAEKMYDIYIQSVGSEKIKEIIKNSLPPVFISSLLYNMCVKETCSDEENSLLEELNEIGNDDWGGFEFTKEILKETANFEIIEKKFEDVIVEKETILRDKLANLVPVLNEKYNDILKQYYQETNSWMEQLKGNSIENLKNQKRIIDRKKDKIKLSLEEFFNEVKSKMDDSKFSMMKSFRKGESEASNNINERTGTKTHTSSRWVSTSKWYNPFSWGGGYNKTSTYTTSYKYYRASDAIESIIQFVNDSSNKIERTFNGILNPKKIKLELKKQLVESIDTDSEDFSPEYFRYLIAKVVNMLEIPIMNINVDYITGRIGEKFSGEIQGSKMSDFKKFVLECLNDVFNELKKSTIKEIENISFRLNYMKSQLFDNLAGQIIENIKKLEKELEQQITELEQYEKLCVILEHLQEA